MREINTETAVGIIESGSITKTIDAGSMLAHEIKLSNGKSVLLIGDMLGRFLLID